MKKSGAAAKTRCWGLSPEERRWWLGKGEPGVGRRSGFFLAAVVAVGLAFLGMEAARLGGTQWATWRWLTAAAVLGLGWKVRLGDRRASIALIAIFPVVAVPGHLIAYARREPGYLEHLGFWAGSAVLAAAAWTLVFYLAYRAEKQADERNALRVPQAGG